MAALVLIVEDRPDHARLFREFVTIAGSNAVIAPNGREALAVARASRPDAVLVDLILPDIDGCDLLAELHADPALEGCLLLATSASIERAKQEASLAAGARQFLPKPVRIQSLVDALEELSPH